MNLPGRMPGHNRMNRLALSTFFVFFAMLTMLAVCFVRDDLTGGRLLSLEDGGGRKSTEGMCHAFRLTYSVKDYVLSYCLIWDGEYLCAMASEEEMLNTLDALVQMKDEATLGEYEEIHLSNEIQIINRYCDRNELVSGEEMMVMLKDRAKYSCVDVVTAVQTIAHQTVYVQDSAHYPYYCTQQEGTDGEQLVEYALAYGDDGALTGKEILSTRITRAAVDSRVVRGSKAYPAAGVTTGEIIWPLAISEVPYISSYFGHYRAAFDDENGHRGIDIPLATDTPVYAADGGTVTHSAETESYGKAVIITHSNGLRTVYAHLNRITAEYGQKIHQGQIIGYSGNTGASTAPHLHFEIRRDNTPVNPFNYLPEKP